MAVKLSNHYRNITSITCFSVHQAEQTDKTCGFQRFNIHRHVMNCTALSDLDLIANSKTIRSIQQVSIFMSGFAKITALDGRADVLMNHTLQNFCLSIFVLFSRTRTTRTICQLNLFSLKVKLIFLLSPWQIFALVLGLNLF